MQDLIDKILQNFTGEKHSGEVTTARREFTERAGVLDQSSDGFDMKMAQFADWYLFSRKQTESGRVPIELLDISQIDFSSEEQQTLDKLKNSRHGIFEFLKIKGGDVYIKDLFAGEKIIIKKSPFSVGFDRGELFEARLIPTADSFEFAPAFCFHPAQASRYILKEIKRVRKIKDENERSCEKEGVINKIFRMKYKLEQYKHVKVEDIYSNSPKVKL